MFGPPDDVDGECNARLEICDDYGDNCATMRCQLPPGHGGMHREEYGAVNDTVVVEWDADCRERR